MNHLDTMLGNLSTTYLKPLAVLDAEIRDELQFHLEMRTLDNMAAGMSPADAVRDAQERFGDFEQSYQACRQATLGLRILWGRLQTWLVAVLGVTVILLSGSLLKVRADYRSSLQALTDEMQVLQQVRAAGVDQNGCSIPCVKWEADILDPSRGREPIRVSEPINWNSVGRSLEEPWCDWRPLLESLSL